MAKLFNRLATSYKAGIDIRSSIDRETKQGSPAYQQQMKVVAKGVEGGGSLANAFAATDGYFPDLVVSVVKAGETGGRLEESFARLGKHYQDLVDFRNGFLQAIAWPAFELVFAVLIGGLLIAICDNIFSAMEMETFDWFWMGSTMGNVIAYYVLAFLLFAGTTILVTGIMRGWFGTLPLRLAMKIPLIGDTIQCMALSRFAWTMSVADNAGMSALDTAELSLNATENFYYTQLNPEVKDSLQSGRQFYPTFLDTEAFPEDVLIHMENGETAGELAESMERISAELQKRAQANLHIIGKIGFVLMLMFAGGAVAFIMIFAVSQYANLLSGLAQP
jgi:type IV pilus assembly protein PilC